MTSFTTPFKRSSNSPLYLAPAIRAPMSRAKIRLSLRFSGTSPSITRWANPSAIAVLPVPGSPTSMGLFLVRRERICSKRRISSSRPITGSSFPSRALLVRSTAYFSKALKVSSEEAEDTFSPWRNFAIAAAQFFTVAPCCFNQSAKGLLLSHSAKNK